VQVDQAGQHGLAAGVDHARAVGALPRQHVAVAADVGDPVALQHDRPVETGRRRVVHRDDADRS
jgi:hypothetical protein